MARLRVKDGSLLQQADFANALKDPWRQVESRKSCGLSTTQKRREVAGFLMGHL